MEKGGGFLLRSLGLGTGREAGTSGGSVAPSRAGRGACFAPRSRGGLGSASGADLAREASCSLVSRSRFPSSLGGRSQFAQGPDTEFLAFPPAGWDVAPALVPLSVPKPVTSAGGMGSLPVPLDPPPPADTSHSVQRKGGSRKATVPHREGDGE